MWMWVGILEIGKTGRSIQKRIAEHKILKKDYWGIIHQEIQGENYRKHESI